MRFSSFEQMLGHYAQEDSPALIFDQGQGKETVSYADLLALVKDRQASLQSEGKTSIGVFCNPTLPTVVTILAAIGAKMQVVMLDEGQSDKIVADQLVAADVDSLFADDPDTVREFSPFLTQGVEKDASRVLFFTSGTTSSSKAVVLSEQSLLASAYNGSAKLPLGREDTLLCLLPLSHVFGFICSLLWGLASGAKVALGRGMRYIAQDFGYFEPTVVSVVPMLLGFLLKNNLLNPALHTVLVGAGDCPQPMLDAVKAMGKRVSFGYGLTETSSGVALSVGGDPRAMEICPDDRIEIAPDGEILIWAPTCLMQGYYKDPVSTAQAIKDGWLYTGDLGTLDQDGRLHVTGRKKEMLVLPSGTKIFLPEYEGALIKALGNPDLAVVLLGDRPVLVIKAPKEQKEAITQALRAVMENLPRAQQISKVVTVDYPLPRTATGKVKRWEIHISEE